MTNPIQISFMIFATVILVGVSATGIWTLAPKQTAAADEYNKAVTRHDREKRIVDIIKDEKPKK